ncbi:TVP38/TMEM64 family protein [Aporhodopirellula aestuarii]|uniref:TVP38/TMEM64 family membrane protein n=1 Tax=Aporhodopirellula aestuarii TaxID=2950107 RepID=A0ABT0U102_9BACT|nr:VTT domain-containing protein [Aporhodopirellula aestuarii]MCM2370517.1 VTT domain-containing protein [Aporhodopirellula aestuarii]
MFRQRRRLIPLAILLAALTWLATGNSLATARQILESSHAAGPIGFVILGTGLMCFFVPKTFISLAAGGLFGMFDGAWILTTTALVSAMVNYHIGRWTLPSRPGEADLSELSDLAKLDAAFSRDALENLDRLDERDSEAENVRQRLLRQIANMARESGWGFHLAIRLTPIPTTIISYTMGAASARKMPYAGAAIAASIPQWLWVYCGAAAASDDQLGLAKIVGVGCTFAAAIVLSIWVPRRIVRAFAAESASRESDPPEMARPACES